MREPTVTVSQDRSGTSPTAFVFSSQAWWRKGTQGRPGRLNQLGRVVPTSRFLPRFLPTVPAGSGVSCGRDEASIGTGIRFLVPDS
jgi:hypothetical protein